MAYWALFFFILGGFFRRILGKTFKIKGVKIHRFWKLVILALLCMLMYFVNGSFPKNWRELLCMSWAVGWMIRFNNHSHSGMFGLYDNTPFRPKYGWIRVALETFFGKGKYYNFAGRFIGLMLGYLIPSILASITMPNGIFAFAGITTPFGYAFAEGGLKDEGNSEYAEILNGAIMFLLFFMGTLTF